MSKSLKEQWNKLAFGQEKQSLNEALDPMDESSVNAICKQSFEFDTLVKVQGVILEAYPDSDTGDVASMHVAKLSNGLELDFEQLQELVCEWMVSLARECADIESDYKNNLGRN